MKKLSKISLRNVSDLLSEKELKSVTGGYGDGSGYGNNAIKNYCWKCTNSAKLCTGSFDGCINAFAEACPAGGAFYQCEPL